jgi:hypothetical protein
LLAELKRPVDVQLYGLIARMVTENYTNEKGRALAKPFEELLEFTAKESSSLNAAFWEIGSFFFECTTDFGKAYSFTLHFCSALEGSWDKKEV